MGTGVAHTLAYTAAWPLRIRLARKKEGCVRDFFSYKPKLKGSSTCMDHVSAWVSLVRVLRVSMVHWGRMDLKGEGLEGGQEGRYPGRLCMHTSWRESSRTRTHLLSRCTEDDKT